MRVLVACEFSGVVRDAFASRGHDAWSCDLLETERPGQHYVGSALYFAAAEPWDLMIAHPPCTYLCNSGARWLYGGKGLVPDEIRMQSFREAAHFFVQLKDHSRIPRIAVENPIPHRRAKEWTGDYTQIVQPWMFGHGETKATCLWLKNLPKLEPTDVVEGREGRVHRATPGPARWKERSRTLSGLAAAMAEQWGVL